MAAIQSYTPLERAPAEYLIETDGDVLAAAEAANVDRASFVRALGQDSSLPQVTRAIHVMALMSSLELLQLAKGEIAHRFVNDDPDNPATKIPIKDLINIFKFSADFISLANSSLNPPRAGTNRFMPPNHARILEAARSTPTSASSASPNSTPEAEAGADPGVSITDEEAEDFVMGLREKIMNSPPEVRLLFEEAIASFPPEDGEYE